MYLIPHGEGMRLDVQWAKPGADGRFRSRSDLEGVKALRRVALRHAKIAPWHPMRWYLNSYVGFHDVEMSIS